jgi:hypothetical protein
MTPTVVILSCPQDLHAHAMCEALERKGARARFVYTPDFPSRLGLSIAVTAQGTDLYAHGPVREPFGRECTGVWYRRPYFGKTPEDLDEEDRKVVERESRDLRLSFFDLLCPSALWVNPLDSTFRERCKPSQLVIAKQCGFSIPPTLVSNDPQEIRSFVEGLAGAAVYKTFNALVPTSVVTPDMLADDEALRWTPGIYQGLVEKEHELRVTVVGHRMFATKIDSQATARGKIDWREAQWQRPGVRCDLAFRRATLPPQVRQACRRLMRALSLVYGAIDLIVTPRGEYVFLEVNPSGQFLWVDHAVGFPILDAMAEMLMQGRADYTWNPRSPQVVFDAELLRAAEERERQSRADHVIDLC